MRLVLILFLFPSISFANTKYKCWIDLVKKQNDRGRYMNKEIIVEPSEKVAKQSIVLFYHTGESQGTGKPSKWNKDESRKLSSLTLYHRNHKENGLMFQVQEGAKPPLIDCYSDYNSKKIGAGATAFPSEYKVNKSGAASIFCEKL